MPSLVTAFVAAIGAAAGGTFGATLIMFATQIASVLVVAGTIVGAYAMGERAKRKARAAYNASQVDRLINIATTTYPRELVLGRVRKGGSVFFRGSVGQHKEKFVMLVALANHEIDGVETFYLNDTEVAVTPEGWVTTAPYAREVQESQVTAVGGSVTLPVGAVGTITSLSGFRLGNSIEEQPLATLQVYKVLKSFARLRVYTGAPGQTADAQVMADFPSLWTSAHTATGVAYLVCEFFYDETAFPSGIPAATVKLRGAKCYDPRTSQTVWTNNPALHARHILLHPHFGKRTSLTAAEDARIVAAANACDTLYTYAAKMPAGTTLSNWSWVIGKMVAHYVSGGWPLFRSDIVIPYGTTAADALDDVVQAMAGRWAYAGGELHIKAGVYTTPVKALTENDLAVVVHDTDSGTSQQPVSIVTHRARADKFNTVNVRIWDAVQDYKQTPLSPLKAPALITRDGAALPVEVDMPAVSSSMQALLVAGIMMRDARDPLTVNVTMKLSAYNLELFDNVTLSIARYGWVNKPFTVLGRTWSPHGGVVLTLNETAPEIYQPDAEFEVDGYGDNTALAKPWDITPPTGLAAFSGTDELFVSSDGSVQARVRVTWTPILDASILVGGQIELRWAHTTIDGTKAFSWQSVLVDGSSNSAHLLGAVDRQTVVVQARTRSTVAVSSWGETLQHTVVGKSEPPATVPAITVSGTQLAWAPVADVDLAGYRLRFNYGSDTWWDYAAPLHDGLITESPYTLERVPAGECTIMVKAVDTSGNESASAAFAVYVFPESLASNVLLSYAQHPAFTGTIAAGTLVSGELLADALDDFYAPADGPMYLPSTEAMYLPSQYAAMSYEFAVTPADPGTLRLQLLVTGAYRVEYATGGADPMYTPVGDPMYEPVDEPFFGTPSAWQLWPGSLAVDGTIQVRLRITLAAGELRGEITEVTAVLDVPDITESLAAVAIGSGGTRLPITRTYRGIKTVGLTVHSGGTGSSARIVDKDATLGPLIQVINTSGTAVAGTVDAQIQGY